MKNKHKKIDKKIKRDVVEPRVFARVLSIENTKNVAGSASGDVTCVGTQNKDGSVQVDCTYEM